MTIAQRRSSSSQITSLMGLSSRIYRNSNRSICSTRGKLISCANPSYYQVSRAQRVTTWRRYLPTSASLASVCLKLSSRYHLTLKPHCCPHSRWEVPSYLSTVCKQLRPKELISWYALIPLESVWVWLSSLGPKTRESGSIITLRNFLSYF